jgi:predicted RNase H-like nuclease (RuvC/YqgF family)
MAVAMDNPTPVGAAVVTTLLGIAGAIRWWYGLKKLDRVDKTDKELATSLRWMMEQMRKDLETVKAENKELREALTQASDEISRLRSLIARHAPDVDVNANG